MSTAATAASTYTTLSTQQGNPFADEESQAADEEMEEDPDLESPPAARAKQKLKTVLKTIQVRPHAWGFCLQHT